jgi:tetratricopeptide (TPR) repeat protein
MAYSSMSYAGVAKNYLAPYDQAVPWFRRAIEANRNRPHAHFVLGVALALRGRLDEARTSVQAGIALNPSLIISRARANWTAMSDDPTHLAQLEQLLEGLRKAGVPEQ